MIEDFVDNSVIRYLAVKPYWTGNIDGKKPLDIVEYGRTGRIRGASSEQCLTTLSELLRIVNAVPEQFVYSLNAERDKIVVLDIESKCPDDIKQTLLNLPFIYGDISMSGKGLHLVFPCPALDEITINKVAMKEEHGYYEILIHHFVSFTHNTIFPRYTAENAPVQFQQIWDELRTSQRNTVKKEYDGCIDDIDVNTKQCRMLRETIIRNYNACFRKTPEDYYNDMSRYEFAVIGFVRKNLLNMMGIRTFAKYGSLDELHQIALVYSIVTEILPYRPKHDEMRDGKPLLLYQTFNSFATSESYK